MIVCLLFRKPLNSDRQTPTATTSTTDEIIFGRPVIDLMSGVVRRHGARRRKAEECQKLSLYFEHKINYIVECWRIFHRIEYIFVFVRPVFWWTDGTAPTIRKVINEVNNNNRNKISWKFNLINYFRVFCACQHCQTKIRWTKKNCTDSRYLDFWFGTVVAIFASSHLLKRISLRQFIHFFHFLKIRLSSVCVWRRSLALSLQVSTCVFISSKQIHWCLSRNHSTCVSIPGETERRSTHKHII